VLERRRGQEHVRDRLLPAAEHWARVCAVEAQADYDVAASADKRLEYALEGSIFIGGAVVQWLRDNLRLIGSSADVESAGGSVPDAGGVVFVPAFVGLGAPHWDAHAGAC
jgi:glycerol kinase